MLALNECSINHCEQGQNMAQGKNVGKHWVLQRVLAVVRGGARLRTGWSAVCRRGQRQGSLLECQSSGNKESIQPVLCAL